MAITLKYPQLQLSNQLCHRLYKASNGIVRSYHDALKRLDLTYPQYLVMMALWEKDQISITQLLDATAIDGAAMTQILRKMTDKGLLKIVADEADRRRRIIKLQEKGLRLQHSAADIPQQILCKFPSLSTAQLRQLMSLLDLVAEDLDSHSKKS